MLNQESNHRRLFLRHILVRHQNRGLLLCSVCSSPSCDVSKADLPGEIFSVMVQAVSQDGELHKSLGALFPFLLHRATGAGDRVTGGTPGGPRHDDDS